MPPPARLRFYVDADILGVAKLLAAARPDVTYPGDPGGMGRDKRQRPQCGITPDTDDDIWIPVVTEAGWIIISKDRAIGRSPRMRTLVATHGARMVTVASRAKDMNTWEHLEIVVSQWRRIEALADAPGPWIYKATRTGLVKDL